MGLFNWKSKKGKGKYHIINPSPKTIEEELSKYEDAEVLIKAMGIISTGSVPLTREEPNVIEDRVNYYEIKIPSSKYKVVIIQSTSVDGVTYSFNVHRDEKKIIGYTPSNGSPVYKSLSKRVNLYYEDLRFKEQEKTNMYKRE
ncbi:MAG TPA: hypothetical protein P5509_04700, partial [Bacteroidales bacterium]|nr:hypothetical protein [Bacteroidales bacterium]